VIAWLSHGCSILTSPGACKVTGHLEVTPNLLQENPGTKDIMPTLTTLSGARPAAEQLSPQPLLQAQGDTGRRQLHGC